MKIFNADAIDRALDPQATIEAMGDAFRGGLIAPKRHHHEIERAGANGTLLLMPAWTQASANNAFAGVKIVSVFPDNAKQSLPSVQGSYILMDGATGVPLAIMDGARLTLHRTAAASAFAARFLARKDSRRMLMVGAGALAPFLIRAHKAAVPAIEHVSIWNRNAARAIELAKTLEKASSLSGVTFAVTPNLEESAEIADLISCATLAKEPLIRGEWLKPGAHLDLVGAYNLSMREADDEALRRSSVFIDTPACLAEGGDVAVAIQAKTFSAEQVQGDLFALASGAHKGRVGEEEITFFKSVGAAIEDLAAAMLVWRRAPALAA